MSRIFWLLLLAPLTALPLGCTKNPPEQKTPRAEVMPSVPLDEAEIKRRAKHQIDEITAETEAAVRKARTRLKTEAQKRSEDLSAFAVQMAEDAKDRASDIPYLVDQALERHTRRWQENRRRSRGDDDSDRD